MIRPRDTQSLPSEEESVDEEYTGIKVQPNFDYSEQSFMTPCKSDESVDHVFKDEIKAKE